MFLSREALWRIVDEVVIDGAVNLIGEGGRVNGIDREAVRAEVDRLNRELAALRGNERRSRLLAKVNLDVRQAGEVEVNLSYLVRGPSWSPSYDMRADTKAKTLDVTYHAEVRQATGEDWRTRS